MKTYPIILLCLFVFCGWLGNGVQAQQLIDNCAVHYDVFDYYNPTVIRKICMKCLSSLTNLYVLRNDFQECIKTINYVDGFQNCQQISLDGKCKQTVSNTTVVDSISKSIVLRNKTGPFCAQANTNNGYCTYPVFPYRLGSGNNNDAFEIRVANEIGHYGFITAGANDYFLFDFQNFDQLRNTTVNTLSDRLYCKPGYIFTESGCLKNGDPFPTIQNCVNQMGDYCYECAQGYSLQNTRQSCQMLSDAGCVSFELIKGIPHCLQCDNSIVGQYTLYRGTCSVTVIPVHSNVRLSTFCKVPYSGQHCLQTSANLPANCAVVDSQKGTCAQCANVDKQFYDSKSNTCKDRVFSIYCGVKHPVGDSCYTPYCIAGYKYKYPLPTFYPPTFTYVDIKYEKDWRNQFLAAKPTISTDECMVNQVQPLDVNCQTFNQYGNSCLVCKSSYWLTLLSDGSGNYYCSNDLSKFPNISANCIEFTLNRSRCTKCAAGYQVGQNGACQADNGSKCITYDSNGYCTLCQSGYYPSGTGCSLQDLCWLGTSKDSQNNSYTSCNECRYDSTNQVINFNSVCQNNLNNDYCAYSSTSNKGNCSMCILGYTVTDYGRCTANPFYSRYCVQYTQSSQNCNITRAGFSIIKLTYSQYVELYRDSTNMGVTCSNGYVNDQCDVCGGNCASCINDICYSCANGFSLNKYKQCV